MSALVASILTILAALIPAIIKVLYDRKTAGTETRKVLMDRDVSKLRADLARVRAGQTPPNVPQG